MNRPLILTLLISIVFLTSCASSLKHQETIHHVSPPSLQTVEVIPLHRQVLKTSVYLPGQMNAYESVDIYPKVTGFITSMSVDRGSIVRKGEVLVTLTAPELQSQVQEAQSKVGTSKAQISEARAKYEALENTYQRLNEASQTPDAVAPNELQIAQKNAEAAFRNVQALESNRHAAQAGARSQKHIRDYLSIKAPFDGIVTERNLHPGALVGPNTGSSAPIIHIEKISHLRLVVSVPEAHVGGISKGMPIHFTVPAYPDEHFTASVSRISHTLDPKTRTEAVELDVPNPALKLNPGMYADIDWPVQRNHPTFVVPPSVIASTTQRTFVIRVRNGFTQWIDVKRGNMANNQIEIFGPLQEGDQILARASDEIQPNTHVHSIAVASKQGAE